MLLVYMPKLIHVFKSLEKYCSIILKAQDWVRRFARNLFKSIRLIAIGQREKFANKSLV